VNEAVLARVDGRLEEAIEAADRLAARTEELGMAAYGRMYRWGLNVRPLLLLGRSEALLETDPPPGSAATEAWKSLALAHAGRIVEARASLAAAMESLDIGPDENEVPTQPVLFLLESATLIGDVPRATLLAQRLTGLADLPGVHHDLTSVARHLGAAATLAGKHEQARSYYRQALDAAGKIRNRPEIALTRLQLAELLLDHYPAERREALEHLDFSIAECREMKMQPGLDRALRRKLQLQGVDSVSPSTSIDAVAIAVKSERPDLQRHAAPDGTVTLLFTDIEDSTGLTVRLGDQRWLEILRAHHSLIRLQVQGHGGFEVKCQGDGFMLAFGSARRALDCAVAIQQAVEAGNTSHPDAAIKVRIGLHTGEALKEADDFHGKHVVLAARIANYAQGGEILVSSLLRELADTGAGIAFDAGQDVELKGLTAVHRVFRVLRS
jgi:eukaryotic-like serine/threonine-protein kinase